MDTVVVRDPEILGGTPCFRGTRVPFQNLLDYLETGETIDEFLDDFPSVKREHASVKREHAIEALERAKDLLLVAIG